MGNIGAHLCFYKLIQAWEKMMELPHVGDVRSVFFLTLLFATKLRKKEKKEGEVATLANS